jgi:hypothetical protein
MGNVYATVAQFRLTSVLWKAFINVGDDVIQGALNAKAGTIDSSLQSQFVLPMLPFPPPNNPWPYDIQQLNIDLATPLVMEIRGLNPSATDMQVLQGRLKEAKAVLSTIVGRTYFPVFYGDSSTRPSPPSPQAYPMPSVFDVLSPYWRRC